MKESTLTKKILDTLKQERPGWWVKIHGSASQTTGIPDIIGCYGGRFCGFEVKLPDHAAESSVRQRFILHRIRLAGGIAGVVTSPEATLEMMDEFL